LIHHSFLERVLGLRSELLSGGPYVRRDAEALPFRTASQKLARVSLGDATVAAGPDRSV
jgi:hypothetical protein